MNTQADSIIFIGRTSTGWGAVLTAIIIFYTLASLSQPTPTALHPAIAQQSRAAACCLAKSANRLLAPGTLVAIPDIVVERLGTAAYQRSERLSAPLAQRFDRFVEQVAPFWPQLVDNVIVLRHPEKLALYDGANVDQSILVGVAAPRKRDAAQPFTRDNLVMTLYLFLPDELLSGEGLDYRVTGRNVIPYAKAPVPQTLGEMFDWVLAHELWHFLAYRAAIRQLCADALDDCPELDQLLTKPGFSDHAFAPAVSELLGWDAVGNAYALSDEAEKPLRITRGATTYAHKRGAIAVSYNDGKFAFTGVTTRTGYLPAELIHFADLRPVVQSGRYPTVYALVEADHERFAEFGAWFIFNQMHGTLNEFQRIQPTLYTFYRQLLHEQG